MSSIKWTKTYEIAVDTRIFRVFVSEDEGIGFYATCLWYEKERMMKVPSQMGSFQFHHEKRYAVTEEGALSELMAWVSSKFEHVSDLKLVQE